MLQQNKQTLTATLLQPCTSRHERKRGSAVTAAGKASDQHALPHGCSNASSSVSKLIRCQLTQTTKACQNMPPQCSCLSVPKLQRFVKTQFTQKLPQESSQLDCCSREPKGKQKESYFSQFCRSRLAAPRANRCMHRVRRVSVGLAPHVTCSACGSSVAAAAPVQDANNQDPIRVVREGKWHLQERLPRLHPHPLMCILKPRSRVRKRLLHRKSLCSDCGMCSHCRE